MFCVLSSMEYNLRIMIFLLRQLLFKQKIINNLSSEEMHTQASYFITSIVQTLLQSIKDAKHKSKLTYVSNILIHRLWNLMCCSPHNNSLFCFFLLSVTDSLSWRFQTACLYFAWIDTCSCFGPPFGRCCCFALIHTLSHYLAPCSRSLALYTIWRPLFLFWFAVHTPLTVDTLF